VLVSEKGRNLTPPNPPLLWRRGGERKIWRGGGRKIWREGGERFREGGRKI